MKDNTMMFYPEAIHTPLGDGNMRGISFRHCTMKKLLPRQGTETHQNPHRTWMGLKVVNPRQGTRAPKYSPAAYGFDKSFTPRQGTKKEQSFKNDCSFSVHGFSLISAPSDFARRLHPPHLHTRLPMALGPARRLHSGASAFCFF